MKAPTPHPQIGPAVIVVWDADLAMALEMTLASAGVSVIIHDAAADLAGLPLDPQSALIICGDMLPRKPRALVAAKRAAGWAGQGVVITQNAAAWRKRFEPSDGVAVLEMPFMSQDLIGLIRRGRPPGDAAPGQVIALGAAAPAAAGPQASKAATAA